MDLSVLQGGDQRLESHPCNTELAGHVQCFIVSSEIAFELFSFMTQIAQQSKTIKCVLLN